MHIIENQAIIVLINKEKFAENFVRRFADNASLSREYTVEIVDVSEIPPKVSVRVTSSTSGDVTSTLGRGQVQTFTLNNKVDAILENPY